MTTWKSRAKLRSSVSLLEGQKPSSRSSSSMQTNRLGLILVLRLRSHSYRDKCVTWSKSTFLCRSTDRRMKTSWCKTIGFSRSLSTQKCALIVLHLKSPVSKTKEITRPQWKSTSWKRQIRSSRSSPRPCSSARLRWESPLRRTTSWWIGIACWKLSYRLVTRRTSPWRATLMTRFWTQKTA